MTDNFITLIHFRKCHVKQKKAAEGSTIALDRTTAGIIFKKRDLKVSEDGVAAVLVDGAVKPGLLLQRLAQTLLDTGRRLLPLLPGLVHRQAGRLVIL